MNQDVLGFIKRNNINLELLSNIENISPRNINNILFDYAIDESKTIDYVSIADIVGYDYEKQCIPSNLMETLSLFFDRNGNEYQKRSIGMLRYFSDDIIYNLERSFTKEPMLVRYVEDGKYVIEGNGLHRFTILRILYLNELFKANTEDEKRLLREKYRIKVTLAKADIIKTYANFILTKCGKINYMAASYDENYNYNGGLDVFFEDGSKVSFSSNNEFGEYLKTIDFDEGEINYFKQYFNTHKYLLNKASLINFIESYFPKLYACIKGDDINYGKAM